MKKLAFQFIYFVDITIILNYLYAFVLLEFSIALKKYSK